MHDSIKIGILIDIGHKRDINLTCLEKGNPGIGGTEYSMASLPYFFLRNDYKRFVFNLYFQGHESITLSKELNSIRVDSARSAIRFAIQDRCDLFIYNGGHTHTTILLDKEAIHLNYRLRCIAWTHIFLSSCHKDLLYKCNSVKRVVCVSKEHFDQLSDHQILEKLCYVYHGFNLARASSEKELFWSNKENATENYLVVFLGALVEAKGFHLLAKVWKEIKKEVPFAKLKVIGSGKLYNNTQLLGEWGIAEESYEGILRKYLSDEHGNQDESVTFLGLLGEEKKHIMKQAAIGVVNPSGGTETFCLSALEFQALGVPVVSRRFGGLKETILDGKTGLLSYNEKHLKRDIIFLLKNPSVRTVLGENGRQRVNSTFSYSKVLPEWEKVFLDTLNNQQSNKKYFQIIFNKIRNRVKNLIYEINKRLR